MILVLARLALAADPVTDEEVPPPGPSPALLELQEAIEALQRSAERTLSEVEITHRELARARRLLESAAILLDDRRPLEERRAAADQLAATQDPRAVPLLRAGARDRDPEIQLASALAALTLDDPAGVEVARVVLVDPYAPKTTRIALAQRLGNHDTAAAGEVLYAVSLDREVPAGVRAEAIRQLKERYPAILARHGGAPSVVDPLGGVMFVAANGVAGGVLLSSIGYWGQLEDGVAIGAVGGTVVGLTGGTVYAVTRPMTSGQGLAYASGVTWGYVYGQWTAGVAHSAPRYLGPREAEDARSASAGYRALGVLGGIGVGAYALARSPSPADVIEIDAAGYLGSAIALGVTELVAWRDPYRDVWVVGTSGTFPTGVPTDQSYEASAHRRHAGASLVGATVGLATGTALHSRWDLGPEDVLFGLVLGSQAAWLGNYTPPLVGVERSYVRGNVRLPWNGAIAGGLLAAELVDIPVERSVSTLWGSVAGDALGAGLPMVLGSDDPRAIATWMIPIGALGTGSALVAHPYVEPTGGDAVMIGVGTSIALSQGLVLGLALDDLGLFADSEQAPGLMLTAGGATGLGLYGLSAVLEPRADEMLVVGSAATWGMFYGGLIPLAIDDSGSAAGLLSASLTSAAATVGAGLAMRADGGLSPRSTVIPQLAAASGATLGALTAGLTSDEGSDAALGSVIGATLGFGVGVGVELSTSKGSGTATARWTPRLPGVWMPVLQPRVGPDGSVVAVAGVQAHGW